MQFGTWEYTTKGKTFSCANDFVPGVVSLPLNTRSSNGEISVRPLKVDARVCLLNLWDKRMDMSRDICCYVHDGGVHVVSTQWCGMHPKRVELFISASGDIMKRKNEGNVCVVSKLNKFTGRFNQVVRHIL